MEKDRVESPQLILVSDVLAADNENRTWLAAESVETPDFWRPTSH